MKIKTPNTKFITNINWDKDINGLRKVELGDFYSQNIQTTVNNIVAFNPITGTNATASYRDTTNTVDLFLVRKRTIKLYNLWNRILNSGLMLKPNNYDMLTYKAVGSNISHIFTECLNRDSFSGWIMSSISLATDKVFYRLLRFINAAATAYYYYMSRGYLTASYFNIFTASNYGNFSALINSNFNPTSEKFVSLMDELLDVIKSLLDETKLSSELNLTFNDLYFSTESGRNAILTLDTYNSKYNLIAKTDSSYLESNLVPQDKTLLYPQFGSVMSRNTESETWNIRNVIVDTSTYNTENDPDLNIYRKPSKIVCSQLKMDKPIKINTSQYINWNDPDDEPYVMVYNGGTFIHIPDEIKAQPDTVIKYKDVGNFSTYNLSTEETSRLAVNKQFRTNGQTLIGFETLISSGITPNVSMFKRLLGFGPNQTYVNSVYIKEVSIPNSTDINDELYFNSWGGIGIKLSTKPRGSNFKIKLLNNTGSFYVYIDDVLVHTSSEKVLFTAEEWSYGSTHVGYQPRIDTTLSNVKFLYINNNNSEQQPDNQLNIAAKFWKIGTQDTTDPKYNKQDDIKLKLDHPLNELTKFDYFDNLTLYMKLD